MSSYRYINIEIKRDEEEDKRSREKVDKWILITLLSIIVIVPLLISGHVTTVVSPLITDNSMLASGIKGDIFTYFKILALIILTIVVISLFLYKLFFLNYILPKRKVLLFFFVFIITVIMSTVLSPSKTIALFGQYNRNDGAVSYICYVLLMFVAMHIDYPKKTAKYVFYAFYPLVIINFILSMMNFIGHDVLSYESIKKALTLFFPEGTNLKEGSEILGTLNHGNYMSGMFAMTTIIFLTWSSIDYNKKRSVFNMVIALLSFSIVFMALSSSGFLTFLCFIPLILWVVIKSNNKRIGFVIVGIFFILSVSILHLLSLNNPKVWDETVGMFISKNPYVEQSTTSVVKKNEMNPVLLFIRPVEAADAEFKLPELPESGVGAGSGRIYIWEKTLKLTMERPLFGYGLDTLIYNFPHGNIDSRANLETESVIVDKPHNVFIGIIYGTGIIGFIGFIGIVIYTVIKSLKEIITFKDTFNLEVILCITWLAYLFQSMFNDTLPGTAAPLWIVGGLTMGLIYKRDMLDYKKK